MKVKTDLHSKPVDIKTALSDYASQEGNDGEHLDIMQQASEYILALELTIEDLEGHLDCNNVDSIREYSKYTMEGIRRLGYEK